MSSPDEGWVGPDPSIGRSIKGIFIVDPQPVVRVGLRALLDSQPDLRVVGDSGSCLEMVQNGSSVDVAMVDPELKGVCGTEALSHIRATRPGLPVLVFAANNDELRVVGAIRTGVQGYLTKAAKPTAILQAVRVVAHGGCFLDPQVISMVMGQVDRHKGHRRGAGLLTEREKAVLGLLAQGKRNRDISEALFISEHTVKFHLSSLFQKLQAANRTEAVRKAIGQGLVET